MRAVLLLFFVLMLCIQGASSVCAADIPAGQVLYSADFQDYTSLRDTGVSFGTLSGENARMKLENGELSATSSDGEKTYLLLPETALNTDTYVLEFVFRFTKVEAANGYCGLLLSGKGDAPSGRTELLIRADGSVDGYKGKNDSLKVAAETGEPITVRIHVSYGFLVDFQLTTEGGESQTYTPESLNRISSGRRGLVLRNASAALSSVRLVSGGYAELENAPDSPSYMAPADWQLPEESAPPTGDRAGWLLLAAAVSGIFVKVVRRRV